MEALERTVQEVEALEAIFGFEEGGFTVHSSAQLAAAQAAVDEAGAAPEAGWAAPRLEIELRVEIDLDDGGVAVVARLRCGLPAGYPETSCASVSVSIDGVRRATQDELTGSLTEKAAALLGDEAVMELVQELQETAPAVLAADRAAAMASAAAPEVAAPDDDGLGRRWMWAHHISSAARRGLIVKEARSLNLGGYLKPGYPGIVVVEGASGNLEDFVNWMKTSSKHTQAVRGQVDAPGRALAMALAVGEILPFCVDRAPPSTRLKYARA